MSITRFLTVEATVSIVLPLVDYFTEFMYEHSKRSP